VGGKQGKRQSSSVLPLIVAGLGLPTGRITLGLFGKLKNS